MEQNVFVKASEVLAPYTYEYRGQASGFPLKVAFLFMHFKTPLGSQKG